MKPSTIFVIAFPLLVLPANTSPLPPINNTTVSTPERPDCHHLERRVLPLFIFPLVCIVGSLLGIGIATTTGLALSGKFRDSYEKELDEKERQRQADALKAKQDRIEDDRKQKQIAWPWE
jgi:hypothetical protein